MRYLKSYRLFESVGVNKTMIEDFLRDFSDNDIPVKVRVEDKRPEGMSTSDMVAEGFYESVEVGIGTFYDLVCDLDLYGNIDNLTSLNSYLVDDGWVLRTIIVFTLEMENWHTDFLEDGIEYRHDYDHFRATEVVKDMVEDFLRDFSDEDIPVEVEVYQPDPLGSSEDRVLILIGDEDNMLTSEDLPLYQNIDNFISLHEYLLGEGYHLGTIACWIKPHNEPITDQRPFPVRPTGHGIGEISNFISKIEEIENWNKRHPALWHKTFKLIDICYTKNKS